MLHIPHLRELVIRPALEALHLWSEGAEELVLGTALQESGARYLAQLGGGPGLGLWQIEPATHDDVWTNFLDYRPELAQRVRSLVAAPIPEALAGNLWYGAAMCRIVYRRAPEAIPEAGQLNAQAALWKLRYNTPAGKGTAAQYVENWKRYMGATE